MAVSFMSVRPHGPMDRFTWACAPRLGRCWRSPLRAGAFLQTVQASIPGCPGHFCGCTLYCRVCGWKSEPLAALFHGQAQEAMPGMLALLVVRLPFWADAVLRTALTQARNHHGSVLLGPGGSPDRATGRLPELWAGQFYCGQEIFRI